MRTRLSIIVSALLAVSALSASAQQAGEARPVVSASVNSRGSAQLLQGSPLLLEVSITHPELLNPNAAPIRLQADSGSWAGLLQIIVTTAAGQPVAWPVALLNSPRNQLTLDGDQAAQLQYALSPARTAPLAPGRYRVEVVLDSSAQANASTWKGVEKSERLTVEIIAEPATLSRAQLENKQRARAEYFGALGNIQDALREIDALLQADSQSIWALNSKASLLQQLNRPAEALALVIQARQLVQTLYPNATEPPRTLWQQQADLTDLTRPGRINWARFSPGTFTLQWNTVPGDTYTVQTSPDLQTWSARAFRLLAETNSLTWSTNLSATKEFFRVVP